MYFARNGVKLRRILYPQTLATGKKETYQVSLPHRFLSGAFFNLTFVRDRALADHEV